MAKFLILYDSQTGNTEKMAQAVMEGAQSVPGVEVELKYYAGSDELAEVAAIAFGAPTYHHEITLPIKQILEEAAKAGAKLEGKIGAAFGSYGWSGEAIVFQRQDGIYLLRLQNKVPERLVSYGTYPRWSPDGGQFVFVHGNAIMLADAEGRDIRNIAVAEKARAVCFAPDGKSVYFSDGTLLKKVELGTGRVTILLENNEYREADLSADGLRLAATVRTLLGTKVLVYDLAAGGKERTVAKGCSASLSPDGLLITVNGEGHELLHRYDWHNLRPVGFVSAPPGLKFDNQFWSNHPEWLVSTSEGASADIYLHQVPSDTSFRVTTIGDCDPLRERKRRSSCPPKDPSRSPWAKGALPGLQGAGADFGPGRHIGFRRGIPRRHPAGCVRQDPSSGCRRYPERARGPGETACLRRLPGRAGRQWPPRP